MMQNVKQVRVARAEVMAANEAAIDARKQAKRREAEEVEAILSYQAMKVLDQLASQPDAACDILFTLSFGRRAPTTAFVHLGPTAIFEHHCQLPAHSSTLAHLRRLPFATCRCGVCCGARHRCTLQDEEMRRREVAEAERQQMMKARQQKLLEGQQVLSAIHVETLIKSVTL